jgi:hypothetical protein
MLLQPAIIALKVTHGQKQDLQGWNGLSMGKEKDFFSALCRVVSV